MSVDSLIHLDTYPLRPGQRFPVRHISHQTLCIDSVILYASQDTTGFELESGVLGGTRFTLEHLKKPKMSWVQVLRSASLAQPQSSRLDAQVVPILCGDQGVSSHLEGRYLSVVLLIVPTCSPYLRSLHLDLRSYSF